MITKKTKSFYHISLSDAKFQLDIDLNDNSEDIYINSLIKSSVELCEDYLGFDIATTQNTVTFFDVVGKYFNIREKNLINLESISYINDNNEFFNIQTGETIVKQYHRHICLELPFSIDAKELYINLQTGYKKDKLPNNLKLAILLKVREMYDFKSSIMSNSYTNNMAFERLLNQIY